MNSHNVTSSGRRVIGPIPPRDKAGKLCLPPIPGKLVKLNAVGDPVRDANGVVVEIDGDLRDPREYKLFEKNMTPTPESVRGLSLFEVDVPSEPLVRVYARDEAHALEVYKRELGVQRISHEFDPVVRLVS